MKFAESSHAGRGGCSHACVPVPRSQGRRGWETTFRLRPRLVTARILRYDNANFVRCIYIYIYILTRSGSLHSMISNEVERCPKGLVRIRSNYTDTRKHKEIVPKDRLLSFTANSNVQIHSFKECEPKTILPITDHTQSSHRSLSAAADSGLSFPLTGFSWGTLS